ncbi:capsular polysaccharide biosynthesis protein [Pararhodobacter zhoushanensis]|uniref:Capsular polysaccharide biosynthesis protein n=1 Tax=Pararhodobacter zhoushanensis TaxID=2479545 RepID=A0ABT3H320_9RHOB|nr:capsular polysaccharide biosynthesis protein [Pararhodobacter zhoushanensis]MCW1934227.1 capsular polysaccharide biosynthesis protein [Pararhodobacter zhoushanensis]
MAPDPSPFAGRLLAASGGFLGPSAQARRIRRILDLAVARPRLGWPGAGDAVLAWGHSPRAHRAETLAARSGAPLWRIEDAWIRSIHPGRSRGEPPMGLLLDRAGMHYDPAQPSDLERLLATHPLDDGALIARARTGIDRLRTLHLSKYNTHDLALTAPDPGYVLIIDQVRGDASLTHGAPQPAERLFREMLIIAQEENPGARVLIRAHPESRAGGRPGYYGAQDAQGHVSFVDGPHSPWSLLEGAVAVYTVASQVGFEAILAGHRPRVFGAPFYAGWGLSADENPVPRRQRVLTRTQLFALAMLEYPLWYDPLRDRLCAFEDVVDQMEARLTAYRQDRQGHIACGMRRWKRGAIQAFFGRERPVRFGDEGATLAWASTAPSDFTGLRIEDGFLRSRGLGADLVPPLSLAVDDRGIYYDPTRESRLEALIAAPLPPGGAARAERLRAAILASGVTKYNLAPATSDIAAQVAALRAAHQDAPVILVPGQVEDDASIRLGTTDIRTNRALLQAVRGAHPEAIVLYKPHPDVEAGLRPGKVDDAETLADLVLDHTDAQSALTLADRVWTLTSGLGFEALLRGIPVTTLGAPFYAGWGLTNDRGTVPERRTSVFPRPDLTRLTHAALIAYPRYLDPLTRQPCPPELAVERLAAGQTARRSPRLRALAKLQGAFASYAHLWR